MTESDAVTEHARRDCQCEYHRARRTYMVGYRQGVRRRVPPAPKPEPPERLPLPPFRIRCAIEQAIARGWPNSHIMRELLVSYDHVRAVRLYGDQISEAAT